MITTNVPDSHVNIKLFWKAVYFLSHEKHILLPYEEIKLKSSPFGNPRGYLRTETLGSFIPEMLKNTVLLPKDYVSHTGHFPTTVSLIGSKSLHI